MNTIPGPLCEKCGGTRWRPVEVPLFRVEACEKCPATRAVTDSGLARSLEEAASSVVVPPTVYLVIESWGNPKLGTVVEAYKERGDAEREAARRRRRHAAPTGMPQYWVEVKPVL